MNDYSNINDDYMDDSSWENLFKMAETFEEQEESPVYDNVNFFESSSAKDQRYDTPEEVLKVLFG